MMTMTTFSEEDAALNRIFGDGTISRIGDTTFLIKQLTFHYALFVNPNTNGGYDDRYCMMSYELAQRAIDEFGKSGKIRLWQKHHNKGISIACGNLAFKSGELQIPKNALHSVDWNIDDLRAQYAPEKTQELRKIEMLHQLFATDSKK